MRKELRWLELAALSRTSVDPVPCWLFFFLFLFVNSSSFSLLEPTMVRGLQEKKNRANSCQRGRRAARGGQEMAKPQAEGKGFPDDCAEDAAAQSSRGASEWSSCAGSAL